MLQVRGLEAGYGDALVLHGVELAIGEGEFVTLLGRNGMGKTTLVRAVMGLIEARAGEVLFHGRSLSGMPAHGIARLGIGLVPEGRQIFPTLTVEENLVATAAARFGPARWTLERVYRLFPRLSERKRHYGSQLSGGEQQMLAVGRALMTNPKLLILDEATEGLAPLIREEIWHCLAALKQEGEAMLVVDKNIDAMARIADRHVVLVRGEVAWSGSNAEFLADPALRERYLHI